MCFSWPFVNATQVNAWRGRGAGNEFVGRDSTSKLLYWAFISQRGTGPQRPFLSVSIYRLTSLPPVLITYRYRSSDIILLLLLHPQVSISRAVSDSDRPLWTLLPLTHTIGRSRGLGLGRSHKGAQNPGNLWVPLRAIIRSELHMYSMYCL